MMAGPDATWPKREMVELYLQSLPRRSYRILMFAVLVKALPLQSFGNVFYVPDFPHVVEHQFQRGHRGARQSPLLFAGSVLRLLPVFTALVFAAFVLLLRRLVVAWKQRR